LNIAKLAKYIYELSPLEQHQEIEKKNSATDSIKTYWRRSLDTSTNEILNLVSNVGMDCGTPFLLSCAL
jgi:hypothetical protein